MHVYIVIVLLAIYRAVKYTLNAENIPDPSCVAPLHGSHLDSVMPGVQVTTGLGFFLHSVVKVWITLL